MTIILGLGKTGFSMARYMQRAGENFQVFDSRETPPYAEQLQQQCPGHTCLPLAQANLDNVSQLLVSPGISLQHPLLKAARAQSIPILGDIELFVRQNDKPIVAITGTNGKGSVTTLVQQMAQAAGLNAIAGGNIGTPVLDLPPADLYVLELSSFQLQSTTSLSATVATILNITPDHLDQHQDMAEYIAAKQRIYQQAGYCITNADDPLTDCPDSDWQFSVQHAPTARRFALANGNLGSSEQVICQANELAITGTHNISNILTAFAIGRALDLPVKAMRQVAINFTGLPHRCQLVGDYHGIRWYNDSKATNIGACQAAVTSFGAAQQLIVLAGGDAKEQDLTALRDSFAALKQVIVFGKDAARLGEAIARDYQHVNSLEAAVQQAAKIAKAGDIVLLSPACSSLDQFTDFTHRGEVFQQLVNNYGKIG